ncbi:hypothetical protein JCM25156A_08360 [Komagataeibacter kakiaceti JCM 25156]
MRDQARDPVKGVLTWHGGHGKKDTPEAMQKPAQARKAYADCCRLI